MDIVIPLRYLTQGKKATVSQLVGHADEVHRLEELGLRCGSQVEMVQAGSPCIIRLSGNQLCFRDCETIDVLVQPGEED